MLRNFFSFNILVKQNLSGYANTAVYIIIKLLSWRRFAELVNFYSLSLVFLQVSYGPRRSAMKNTAASTNILEFIWVWLRSGQNYHKAHMMLARNSPCSQEVGLGKLMILIGIYWGRLSLTFRDELSSWFMAGRVGNTNGFSLSS